MTEAELKAIEARLGEARLAPPGDAPSKWQAAYVNDGDTLCREVRRLRVVLTAIAEHPSRNYMGSDNFPRGVRDGHELCASIARRGLQGADAGEGG
jgi:hypothetical protein